MIIDISGTTVERWFVIYKFNNYKFPSRQNTVYKDFNPFSTYNCEGNIVRDNKDLYEELRKWGVVNLKTLALAIIHKKINESISCVFSSIRQWMNGLNTKYVPKKSNIIVIDERKDIKKERRQYIFNNNKQEINEPCWIQFKEKEFY